MAKLTWVFALVLIFTILSLPGITQDPDQVKVLEEIVVTPTRSADQNSFDNISLDLGDQSILNQYELEERDCVCVRYQFYSLGVYVCAEYQCSDGGGGTSP